METNFLAIDFETANQFRNSACAVGIVRVENSQIVHKAVHLIRPPTRDFMFTYIHGISWDDVKNAPTFKEVWKEIQPYFAGINFLAAHNATFDGSVLKACCATYSIEPPINPFICTMKVARRAWNLYPTKLSDVCSHLKIELNHHEALSDAHACAQIILAWQQLSLPDLSWETMLVAKKRPAKSGSKRKVVGLSELVY